MKKALILTLTIIIALSATVCSFAYEPMFKDTIHWREYLNAFEDFAEEYNAYRASEVKDPDLEKDLELKKSIISLYKFRFSKQADNDGMLDFFNEEWKEIRDSLDAEIPVTVPEWKQYLIDFEKAAVDFKTGAESKGAHQYIIENGFEFGKLLVLRGRYLNRTPEEKVDYFLKEWDRIVNIVE